MNDGILFRDIRLNHKPLNQCELYEGSAKNYRLYVDRDLPYNSFYALALEFVSCSCESESVWDCPELEVSPLFNVIAYCDGVRHLEFNREAGCLAGYIYCPNMEALIDMFQKVREIELEVCKYIS